MTQPYVIIGNPNARRVDLFCAALARHGYPTPTIVPYEDIVIHGWDEWSSVFTPDVVVRIESPGEHLGVVDHFLRLGATEEGATATIEMIEHASRGRGEIFHPKQRFLGFRRVLNALDSALTAYPVRHVMNTPAGILTMFDKSTTYEAFEAAGVPAPERLPTINGYDSLIEHMDDASIDRVFIKLSYSSSASGVVAFRRQGGRLMATTSTKMRRDHTGRLRLFNSLTIQRYTTEEDIRVLIDALAHHDVVVESWLPKATFEQMAYDFRVVVIGGRAQHCVMRTSRSPMTNLHLGNARGDIESLREYIGPEAFEDIAQVAEAAFESIGGMTYAGADVMLHSGTLRAHAIEINAFGDLVPRLMFNGEDTYGAEILAVDAYLNAQGRH